jgi:hypothetical protein
MASLPANCIQPGTVIRWLLFRVITVGCLSANPTLCTSFYQVLGGTKNLIPIGTLVRVCSQLTCECERSGAPPSRERAKLDSPIIALCTARSSLGIRSHDFPFTSQAELDQTSSPYSSSTPYSSFLPPSPLGYFLTATSPSNASAAVCRFAASPLVPPSP